MKKLLVAVGVLVMAALGWFALSSRQTDSTVIEQEPIVNKIGDDVTEPSVEHPISDAAPSRPHADSDQALRPVSLVDALTDELRAALADSKLQSVNDTKTAFLRGIFMRFPPSESLKAVLDLLGMEDRSKDSATLALNVAATMDGVLKRNPELYAYALGRFSDDSSLNVQQCLASALRGGVISGNVPEFHIAFLSAYLTTDDDFFRKYLVVNAGGIGDTLTSLEIVDDELNSTEHGSFELALVAYRQLLEVEGIQNEYWVRSGKTPPDGQSFGYSAESIAQKLLDRARKGISRDKLEATLEFVRERSPLSVDILKELESLR